MNKSQPRAGFDRKMNHDEYKAAIYKREMKNYPPKELVDREKIEPLRVKSIGRNEECPCGSGLKYKHCCKGQAEEKNGDLPAHPEQLHQAPIE